MAKKIIYGNILQGYKKQYSQFKKIYKDTKIAQEKIIQKAAQLFESDENNFTLEYLYLLFADFDGDVMHYYLKNPELKNFLYNLQVRDLVEIKKFLQNEYPKQEKWNGFPSNAFYFAIHVPNDKNAWSFIYHITADNYIYLRAEHAGDEFHMEEKHWSEYKNLHKDNTKYEIFQAVSFGLNLILYMKAFPNCVKDGVPNDIITGTGTGKNHSKTLEITDEIIDKTIDTDTNKTISPHFRRGHFRYLQSDFYKEKRGQVIFIHETMVKGNAKTIYPSNNINN